MCSYFTGNLIAWKRRRKRRRRAKSRKRKAKESTRKSTATVIVRVTPIQAAAVIVSQTRAAVASQRAKRERRRATKKTHVGITALRVRDESRVRKGALLPGAGHRALTLDRSGLKRRPVITDEQGQRGEGVRVGSAALRTRSSWREVKRERDRAAGTGRDPAAPSLVRTEAGAAREAGRTEVKTGITAEVGRGTEVAQMEGTTELQMGVAETGKGGKTGRAGEGAGAGVGVGVGAQARVGRKERGVQSEQRESTDLPHDCIFFFLPCDFTSIHG